MGRARQTFDRGVLALIALVLTLLAICGGGLAPAVAEQAAHAGVDMAHRHATYYVKPWVLYESRDPLRAVHGRAGIDAVIVETPYERIRYESYLYALQGSNVTRGMVERWRREAANRLGFLVYAHSRSDQDRTFLRGFSTATVTPAGGAAQPDDRIVRFGPSDDFYDVGTFREERWVGSITYRFPLRSCSERGVVRFHDRYGDRYAMPFDLTRYR